MRQESLLQFSAGPGIEQAIGLETREQVESQHIGPKVGVIACIVPAYKVVKGVHGVFEPCQRPARHLCMAGVGPLLNRSAVIQLAVQIQIEQGQGQVPCTFLNTLTLQPRQHCLHLRFAQRATVLMMR
ncbi:hypothetical protein D3C77_411490 [compost metagenome]